MDNDERVLKLARRLEMVAYLSLLGRKTKKKKKRKDMAGSIADGLDVTPGVGAGDSGGAGSGGV